MFAKRKTAAQDNNYRFDDCLERRGFQTSDLREDQFLAGGKEFPWPRVTSNTKRPFAEAGLSKFARAIIAVGIAGELAQDPVAATGISKNHGGTQF